MMEQKKLTGAVIVTASWMGLMWLLPAEAESQTGANREVVRTEAVGPMRFVAVHGRRSVVMGYPAQGLEIWGYPFQVLSGYQVSFRPRGVSAEVDGRSLLRHIDYDRASVTRTYVGPDYLVRERIFVPLDTAAAVLTYEVEGSREVDVSLRFQPVLDLMWPGAVGGQYTRWLADGPGFQISEPEHGVSAVIGSPETVAHDDTVNSAVRATTTMSFTVRPRAGSADAAKEGAEKGGDVGGRAGVLRATVYVVLNAAETKEPAGAMHGLEAQAVPMEVAAEQNYAALDRQSLRVQTPDDAVNRAVASAVTALDQAWVCNDRIGCGLVAGYGPSRDARRPQYAWFFAGDGLIATNALVSVGEYGRAKEELEFITRYQEPKTGMIWHELSQSAGYIDWSKYPYMYVHVDISFDYLAAVARYVTVSGDTAFARSHWASIAKVYGYCRSLVRASDGLPHIPADKEGGDEQARPGDDLSLSTAWLAASSGYEEMARATGHGQAADEAHAMNTGARASIPGRYWNAQTGFWIDGHTQAGAEIRSRRRGATQLLEQKVFSAEQNEAILDQLASADFRTDWGMREVAASSPDYDPYSYGRGSVTAPSTAGTAVTFWKEHRPAIGYSIWSGLIAWNMLDSPGHLHEVLAGNFFHEQVESVPEQTWSSAGLMDAVTRGLLGLTIRGSRNELEFEPHMPAAWDRMAVENVRVSSSRLGLTMSQDAHGLDLEISNEGSAVEMMFAPELPLGARVLGAEFEGHSMSAEVEVFGEDEHARLRLHVPAGSSHCRVRYEGGVSVMVPRREVGVGDRSTGVKLVRMDLAGMKQGGRTLSIDADVSSQGDAILRLRTTWRIVAQEGATVRKLPGSEYEISLGGAAAGGDGGSFHRAHGSVTFAPE